MSDERHTTKYYWDALFPSEAEAEAMDIEAWEKWDKDNAPWLCEEGTTNILLQGKIHISQSKADLVLRVLNSHAELVEALKACMAYIPGSEVRSWPPGHQLRKEALSLGKAALINAGATP
jgi:hypothetical protein